MDADFGGTSLREAVRIGFQLLVPRKRERTRYL